MLKHRLSKISKAALLMLLVIGGAFQSCEDVLDEYSYDDGKMPSWLGESVYAFLRDNNTGHTYDYYADIVDKLGRYYPPQQRECWCYTHFRAFLQQQQPLGREEIRGFQRVAVETHS